MEANTQYILTDCTAREASMTLHGTGSPVPWEKQSCCLSLGRLIGFGGSFYVLSGLSLKSLNLNLGQTFSALALAFIMLVDTDSITAQKGTSHANVISQTDLHRPAWVTQYLSFSIPLIARKNTKIFISKQFTMIKVQLSTHASLHYGFPWICSVNASLTSRPVCFDHFWKHLINCLLYKLNFILLGYLRKLRITL